MTLKRSYIYGGLIIIGLIMTLGVIWWQISQQSITQPVNTPAPQTKTPKTESPVETDKPKPRPKEKPAAQYVYAQPTDGFKQRATKKVFGTYVSPGNSPVSPERFQGYHTGVDAEYGDVEGDVAVRSIAKGEVIAAQYIDGYGGAVAVESTINGARRVVIYGHLDPDRLPSVGRDLSRNERFGYLGQGYSSETDGERKHLHLAILRDDQINWRGYVQSQSELSAWLNPLTVLSQKQ